MLAALTKFTPVAAVPPTPTVAPAAKPVPAIVIVVPPFVDPETGVTPVTLGGGAVAVYVKLLAIVADCVSGFVTVTPTVPAACDGAVAVIVVPPATLTPVARLPPTL